MKRLITMASLIFIHTSLSFAADDHSAMMKNNHHMDTAPTTLVEAGNDAFGTIQEVIAKLNSNPNTDWSKVDIEALRQHLVDMNDMTLNVDVISQTPIDGGMVAIVAATSERAKLALNRVFSAHPNQLKRETGWEMKVEVIADKYKLTITTQHPHEISKIRGLGYIGLMAYGNHHQPHHWAMATGTNPHANH